MQLVRYEMLQGRKVLCCKLNTSEVLYRFKCTTQAAYFVHYLTNEGAQSTLSNISSAIKRCCSGQARCFRGFSWKYCDYGDEDEGAVACVSLLELAKLHGQGHNNASSMTPNVTADSNVESSEVEVKGVDCVSVFEGSLLRQFNSLNDAVDFMLELEALHTNTKALTMTMRHRVAESACATSNPLLIADKMKFKIKRCVAGQAAMACGFLWRKSIPTLDMDTTSSTGTATAAATLSLREILCHKVIHL